MKCICCGFRIKAEYLDEGWNQEDAVFKVESKLIRDKTEYFRAENRNWYDGVVGNISAGYGSNHDGDQYVIGICDKCVTEKLYDGSLAYTGNYMFKNEYIEVEKDKYRKIWRRNNNLDELESDDISDV